MGQATTHAALCRELLRGAAEYMREVLAITRLSGSNTPGARNHRYGGRRKAAGH
jgi:hypothetical protein